MVEPLDPTAWSGLLLGLYTLAIGLGALRRPGLWQTMIGEIETSPALQLVCGMAEMLLGAAIYLANPWDPADLLACLLKAAGGLMMVEALVIAAFCDVYFAFWLRNLALMRRGWPAFATLLGAVLALVAVFRFH